MFPGLKKIHAAIRAASRPSVEGIHSEEVFKALLEHERARAERHKQFFSVVAFTCRHNPFSLKTVQWLGQIFSNRLRATDVAGWLDSRTIGVMLPQTRFKDSTMVAENICQRMLVHKISLGYKIYLFPHEEGSDKQAEFELLSNLPDAHAALKDKGPSGPVLSSAVATETPKTPSAHREETDALSIDDICVPPLPFWKRCFDILLSLVGIVVCGPMMLLIAAAIKIVSPGPVLFRQKRVGFRGRHFLLYKFRSMRVNADTHVHKDHLARLMTSNVSLTKLDNADARLIPCGKIFRASGLDELPQLFNILRGDMSFIGPRPCVPYEYEKFDTWHKDRCNAYPGLTGLWQVSGKNKTTFTEMMRLDNAYVRKQSLMRDVTILFKTIPAVWKQIKEMAASKR